MLYREDQHIVLGGVTLPGVLKKFEIKPSALIEEVEVEGSSSKPKQAIGYEDSKISIELIIDDTPYDDAETLIADVRRIFRKNKSQTKPKPIAIISDETALFDISKVLFKEMSLNRTNKNSQYALSLELWEYIPTVITATKSGSGSGGSTAPPLTAGYQDYLNNDRGQSPTSKTPAVERQPSATWVKNHLDRV